MNLLAVQGDIAREVSQRLRSQLSAEDCAHLRNADALGFVVGQAGVILFRESKIEQLYNSARGREDVRWFEVAMNDPLAVCGLERGSNLPRELQRLIRRKGLQLFTVDDRPAVNVLHDQKIRADVVNLADVGMIECGDGFGFTLEALAEPLAGNFDRDVSI